MPKAQYQKCIYFGSDLFEILQQRAQDEHMTYSQLVRKMARFYLQNYRDNFNVHTNSAGHL